MMHRFGKLCRCPEMTRQVVDGSLFLAAAFIVTRCLIQRAVPLSLARPTHEAAAHVSLLPVALSAVTTRRGRGPDQ